MTSNIDPDIQPEDDATSAEPAENRFSRRAFLGLAILTAGGMIIATYGVQHGTRTRPSPTTPIAIDTFRRFVAFRGSEQVAWGTQFPDGRCVVQWADSPRFVYYDSFDEFTSLHLTTPFLDATFI